MKSKSVISSNLFNSIAGITDANDWEVSERKINNIRIKLATETPLADSSVLSTEENELVETLANTCPYVGGNAVYYARAIYATSQPDAQYDDRVLCTPPSANRTTGGNTLSFDEEQNLADSLALLALQAKKVDKAMQDAKTHVIVYPNPAKNNIRVTYNCNTNGFITFYNNIGQPIHSEALNADIKTVIINTTNFEPGLYTYKASFKDCASVNGKLVILK
jgi:hypothetical protein